jgi:hypothetical protein
MRTRVYLLLASNCNLFWLRYSGFEPLGHNAKYKYYRYILLMVNLTLLRVWL